MRRGNCVGQAPESRPGSSILATYDGTNSRCTGLTIIYGHIVIDATAADQIVVIDDSMDWRDRIVSISAFTPAAVASGVPPAGAYLCTPTAPVNNYFELHGNMWLTAGGWDAVSPRGGSLSYCNMLYVIDRAETANVRWFADNVQGQLKVKVASGNNRGITYMIMASEQLGYTVAQP